MKEITVDVIIPVYRPGERFGELLKRLDAQNRHTGTGGFLKRDTVCRKIFRSFM